MHLTLRSYLPAEITTRFRSFLSSDAVTVIDDYLDWQQYSALMNSCHVYLIPAARIHVYSLLESMYHGLAIVASDGWGIRNYVIGYSNGLMVAGLYGRVSWQDDNGQLSEDYRAMFSDNPIFEESLYVALSDLAHDDAKRRRLATAAQVFVRNEGSIERFNSEFGPFLDRILADDFGTEAATAAR